MINGLTSSNSIRINNNNGNAHCPQLSSVAQSPDPTAVSMKPSHHLPMTMPLESRDRKEGQVMPGSISGLSNEMHLHQQPNRYNSSNNPLSMMGGMMQQQHVNMQHQQHQPHPQQPMMQGPFAQHGNSMMGNRQMPALAALSNLGDSVAVGGQLNSSLELDDNDMSPDEDDDELDHDLDELDAAKQQLIDGGSSSSTSLQAPPSQLGSVGSGGHTPGSKKDKPSYNCLLCPKSYRKRKSLLDHYKMHPGYCHDCGQPNGNTLEVSIS